MADLVHKVGNHRAGLEHQARKAEISNPLTIVRGCRNLVVAGLMDCPVLVAGPPVDVSAGEDEDTDEGQDSDRSGERGDQERSLPEIMGKALASLDAQAAFFTSQDGIRTALIVFDMTDSSDIPSAAEPFYMAFDAQISFEPVMNADDMRAGVGKAMEAA
jgi:hypothetical protein